MDLARWLALLCILLVVALVGVMRRAAELEAERNILRQRLDKFDHDGDGYPGGSRRRRKP